MADHIDPGAEVPSVNRTVKLGNARHLLDMSAPAHRVLSEIERWDLDPVMNARDLLGGQIYDVRAGGPAPAAFANATEIELLWLPKVQRGAVRTVAGTDWVDAGNPQELLQVWSNDSSRSS
jgi:hypothetical protein